MSTMDYGDVPENTVSKELEEETGLVAKDDNFLFFRGSVKSTVFPLPWGIPAYR